MTAESLMDAEGRSKSAVYIDAIASFLPYFVSLLGAVALMVSAFDIAIVTGGWYFVFLISAAGIMALCGVLCLCFRKTGPMRDMWDLLDDELFACTSFFISAAALAASAIVILAWMVTWKPVWFVVGTAPIAYQTASYLNACNYGATVLSIAFGAIFPMFYGNAIMRKNQELAVR